MSPSGSLLSGLSAILTLGAIGAACAPSSNAGRTPRAGVDSSPDATQGPAPEETSEAPEVTADPPVSPPPRAPVAVKPVYLPPPAGPYRVRIVDERHHDLPRFVSGGRTYVLGTIGSRYEIVVSNPTARRVEVVASVDGLDVMDGRPANYVEKRGYILPAYGDTTIEGFRTSLDDVATFRFSSVANSYAGRLGEARDVGVIGVAFFPEQAPVAVAQPAPAPPMYEPPRSRATPSPRSLSEYDIGGGSGSAPSPAAGAAASPSVQSAPAPKEAEAADEPAKRRGLGTEFGEARASRVETTEFVRASSSHPGQIVSVRYNDRAGLVALGIAIPQPYAAVDRDQHLRETADPFRANRFAQPPP